MESAYKTLAMVGKFPFVVLHLNMDPSLVDVNVHPTKLQVRFKNVELIDRVVHEAVKSTLSQEYLVPSVDLDKPRGDAKIHPIIEKEQLTKETFFVPRKEDNEISAQSLLSGTTASHELPQTNPYKPSSQTVERLFGPLPTKEAIIEKAATYPLTSEPSSKVASENEPLKPENKVNRVQKGKEESEKSSASSLMDKVAHYNEKEQLHQEKLLETQIQQEISGLSELGEAQNTQPLAYQIIGQCFRTYWLIQYGEKMFIIDQHAAHERVLYERFMAYFKSGEVAT